jgi:hypothetical protein
MPVSGRLPTQQCIVSHIFPSLVCARAVLSHTEGRLELNPARRVDGDLTSIAAKDLMIGWVVCDDAVFGQQY